MPRSNQSVEGRCSRFNAIPQTQLAACHTQNGRLLPDRRHLLDCLPAGATVAEVGVAKGAFSREIIDHTAPEVLHLIDAWHVDRYRGAPRQVRKRLAREIDIGQVQIHRGLSTEVLARFPAASLDWVYIDTNHTYETTLKELRLCDRLLGPEGRIAGHDFCPGNVVKPVVYGVI